MEGSLRLVGFSILTALENRAIPTMQKTVDMCHFALHDFEAIIESTQRN